MVMYVASLGINVNAAYKITYLPILEEGKKWSYTNYAVSGELHGAAETWNWQVVGMSDEDGHSVSTLLYTDSESDVADVEYRYTKKEYEEDGALWSYSAEKGRYLPMIDFNLEVGDKVAENFEVIWKDRIDIEGVVRWVIAIENPGWGKMNYWIEGIGAIDDVYISPIIRPIGERTRMTACWIGDTCLFDITHMDDYVSEVKSLTGQTAEDPSLYDILGRRITAPIPGQLYIQGGKKHIAK